MPPHHSLWVVVPAYDEQRRLPQTLAALAAQDDLAFTLVVVDNGSTDGTRAVVERFAAPFDVHLRSEPERGVGSAVDTGFRFAIAHGAAFLARTDADCLPRRDWVGEARAGFADGAELVCGRIAARRDENGPLARAGFQAMVATAALFGRFRTGNRGPAYLIPYGMHAGHNMAITTDLYLRCGGMPRIPDRKSVV